MRWFSFINRSVIVFSTIFIAGCYTVIWTPDDRMPSDSEYYNQQNDSGISYDYYPPLLFGAYNYYYVQPWWYDLSYTPNIQNSDPDNDLTETESLRNSGNGRNTDSGRTTIIETAPPSKPTNTNSGSNTNSNSGTTTQTEKSSDRSNSSGNDNSIRNDNGSRNSEGKRK